MKVSSIGYLHFMLIPILNLVSISNDGTTVTVVDATGNYSISNPGGFGAPNPLKSAITGILLKLTSLNDLNVNTSYRLLSGEVTSILSTGTTFGIGSFPVAGSTYYQDGVYDMAYDILYTGTGSITYTGGSKTFSLPNADTIFSINNGTVGFSLGTAGSKVYYIDRTLPLTSAGGSVTESLPTTGGSVSYEVAYEASLKILVDVNGNRCLVEDIAIWTTGGCIDDNFRDIWKRFAQRIAIKSKFSQGYLYDAHELALILADYCDTLKTGSPCC